MHVFFFIFSSCSLSLQLLQIKVIIITSYNIVIAHTIIKRHTNTDEAYWCTPLLLHCLLCLIAYSSLERCLLSSELFGNIQTSNTMVHSTWTWNQNRFWILPIFWTWFQQNGFQIQNHPQRWFDYFLLVKPESTWHPTWVSWFVFVRILQTIVITMWHLSNIWDCQIIITAVFVYIVKTNAYSCTIKMNDAGNVWILSWALLY